MGASCVAPPSDASTDAAGVLGTVPQNQCLAWFKDADSSQIATVPPAANQFNLVFDRVIDGSKIEDTFTDGGFTRQYPKLGADGTNASPVTLTWTDSAMQPPPQPPPLSLVVWYNSVPLPFEVAGSSYVYGRARSDNLPVDAPNPTLTFPSNSTITITLDHARITSEYNEPMDGPETITVNTAKFSVLVPLPTPPAGETVPHAPINYWVPLEFNNRVGDVTSHVRVTQDGRLLAAAEYQVVPDPAAPTRMFVRPIDVRTTPAAPGDLTTRPIWDDGARIEVTVAGDLTDVYGAMLGTTTITVFVAGGAGDGGATGQGDAGGADAGTGSDGSEADGADGGTVAMDAADSAGDDAPAADAPADVPAAD